MGGTKYEHSLHQPYPNGSPAPKFGMYIRFPSGTGGYTAPELLVDIDRSQLKFMHWDPTKPPIIAYMNINLCRKLGIKPCCFRKTIICEANR
eukprot:911227-Prymnesium_polylepis.1